MRQVLFSGIILGVLAHSSSAVEFTRTTATLSQPRASIAATSVGNLALFAGGEGDAGYFSTVDVYHSGTEAWTTDALSVARSGIAAASVGNAAIFAGGMDDSGRLDTVDIYDAQADTWATAALSQPRSGAAAVTVGDTVMIAGGIADNQAVSDVVDIYNSTTGIWSTTTLPKASARPVATVVGDKAVFVLNNEDLQIAVYDVPTGVWTLEDAVTIRGAWSAVTLNEQALLIAGDKGVSGAKTAYWVDPYSGESTVERVIQPCETAAAVGTTALFGGYVEQSIWPSGFLDLCRANWGQTGTLETHAAGDWNWDGYVNSIDLDLVRAQWETRVDSEFPEMTCMLLYSPSVHAYDAELDEWSILKLSKARAGMSATSVGQTALFAGGEYMGYSDVVDLYHLVGPSAVPEPSAVGLLLAGIGMLCVHRRGR